MRHVTCAVFTLALALGRIAAQERDYVHDHYSKHEYHIPMRDGARLFLIAYVPNDTAQRYPIILTRTPYSARPYEPASFPHSPDNHRRAHFHSRSPRSSHACARPVQSRGHHRTRLPPPP